MSHKYRTQPILRVCQAETVVNLLRSGKQALEERGGAAQIASVPYHASDGYERDDRLAAITRPIEELLGTPGDRKRLFRTSAALRQHSTESDCRTGLGVPGLLPVRHLHGIPEIHLGRLIFAFEIQGVSNVRKSTK